MLFACWIKPHTKAKEASRPAGSPVFTQASIRLWYHLCCWLISGTTMTPIPCPYALCRRRGGIKGATVPPWTGCVTGATVSSGSPGMPSHLCLQLFILKPSVNQATRWPTHSTILLQLFHSYRTSLNVTLSLLVCLTVKPYQMISI